MKREVEEFRDYCAKLIAKNRKYKETFNKVKAEMSL